MPLLVIVGGLPSMFRVGQKSRELDLLKLPPKFAVYTKSDELLLKSQFEKAVTCLRWNSKLPRKSENELQYPREEIFDYEENNIEFSLLKASKLSSLMIIF